MTTVELEQHRAAGVVAAGCRGARDRVAGQRVRRRSRCAALAVGGGVGDPTSGALRPLRQPSQHGADPPDFAVYAAGGDYSTGKVHGWQARGVHRYQVTSIETV